MIHEVESKITIKLGNRTATQYDEIMDTCRDIFRKKIKDYGTSWRVLRPKSLTDQIFIKAKRIKNIEENGVQKVDDGIDEEYMGIINYCLIALIQMELGEGDTIEFSEKDALELYNAKVAITRQLMLDKNHDYGEAWRDMRATSFTDMILVKLLRLKQIENNQGKTIISEGAESHYMDIINYSAFALIKLSEQ